MFGISFHALCRLRTSLPFLTDPSLLCEDVVYVSPLHSSVGRESYFQLFEHWARAMPERLQDLEIRDVQVYQLKPREVSAKWTYRFVAPLPLPARVPGRLPADLQVLPGSDIESIGAFCQVGIHNSGIKWDMTSTDRGTTLCKENEQVSSRSRSP